MVWCTQTCEHQRGNNTDCTYLMSRLLSANYALRLRVRQYDLHTNRVTLLHPSECTSQKRILLSYGECTDQKWHHAYIAFIGLMIPADRDIKSPQTQRILSEYVQFLGMEIIQHARCINFVIKVGILRRKHQSWKMHNDATFSCSLHRIPFFFILRSRGVVLFFTKL